MKAKLATITFQIPQEQRRALKALAAHRDQPLRALLAGQIDELLQRSPPNTGAYHEPH